MEFLGMASVEVLEDERYQDVNPLDFKSHPKGRQLYWANLKWRSERKGWGQLRPVRKTDSDFEELKSHLSEVPLDLDIQGDNLVRRGDLVLCVKSEEEVEKRQRRNYHRSTRLTRELSKGRNLVAEELQKIQGKDDTLEATPAAFKHGKNR
jgi:hypothetical protein